LSKSDVRTEKYELPGTVDGICSLIREILNGGNVKRIELDTDDTYVRARRWVEGDGLEEDEVTWDGALRNVPDMQEYYSDGATAFQVIVDMMLLAQSEKLHCTCWVTGPSNEDLMWKWLEIEERGVPIRGVDQLLGLPIHRVKSIPEETLILCCSKHPSADPSEISVAVKTVIDLRRSHVTANGKDVGGSGNHSQECDSAVGSVPFGTGRLRRVAWDPPTGHG
jgi:hypothetical protein